MQVKVRYTIFSTPVSNKIHTCTFSLSLSHSTCLAYLIITYVCVETLDTACTAHKRFLPTVGLGVHFAICLSPAPALQYDGSCPIIRPFSPGWRFRWNRECSSCGPIWRQGCTCGEGPAWRNLRKFPCHHG